MEKQRLKLWCNHGSLKVSVKAAYKDPDVIWDDETLVLIIMTIKIIKNSINNDKDTRMGYWSAFASGELSYPLII